MSTEERDQNPPQEPQHGGDPRSLEDVPGSSEHPEERSGNQLGDTADSVTRRLQDLQDELMPPEEPSAPPARGMLPEEPVPPVEAPVGVSGVGPGTGRPVEPPVPPLPPPPPSGGGTWRTTSAVDPEASGDDRLLSMLAWLSLVVLQLPVVSIIQLLSTETQRRPFQRHHAITSLLFFAAGIVYEIVAAIVFTILTTVTLGCGAFCLWVIFLVPHALALYYAFQAYGGKRVELPYLSAFGRQQGWL